MLKKDLKNTRQFKEALKRSEQERKDGKAIGYAYTNNVPLFWCVEFELDPHELLTYCFIRDCTRNMKEGAYTGSIKGLCSRFYKTLPTQRKALLNLERKGFIYYEESPRGEAKWVRYRDALSLWWTKEDTRPLKEILEVNSFRNEKKIEERLKRNRQYKEEI